MPSAISVQNLGKKYVLDHQQQERYTALRDVLASGARHWKNKLLGKGFPGVDPRHEEFWALKDINFEIRQGDRVGIIGRNGAGKSTLLKILSRIVEPTTGKFKIHGRVASLLEVGTGFHPELTGRENIFLNGAILGMGRAEINRKFDEIVAFAEVEKFLDTPVKRYSSGMYVRLAFAVAAHLEPEILIVDEVLAVGDAQFQKKCLGKMNEVSEQGRTVLFVSHNMAAISSLCRTGIVLSSGKIEFSGEITTAINHYISKAQPEKNIFLQTANDVDARKAVQITQVKSYSPGMLDNLVCGSGTLFEIDYVAISGRLKIQFLIGIYDKYDTCVLFLDSETMNLSNGTFPSKGKVQVTLPSDISLYPDTYSVNIAALVNGELIHHVQNAMHITVHEGDFFKTGKWPRGKSLALAKQFWEIADDDRNRQ